MSLPGSDSPTLDWKASLLEAIHVRDAPLAISLAKRCVHRFGMRRLDALLEEAAAASGHQEDPRSWLLPLLNTPASQAEAPPERPSRPAAAPKTVAASPAPAAADSSADVASLGSEAPAQPSASPAMAVPSEQGGAHKPAASPDPPSHQPSRMERPAFARAPLPMQALDEAFAPLEIAFPPLPAIDADRSPSAEADRLPPAERTRIAPHPPAARPTSTTAPQPRPESSVVAELERDDHSLEPADTAADPAADTAADGGPDVRLQPTTAHPDRLVEASVSAELPGDEGLAAPMPAFLPQQDPSRMRPARSRPSAKEGRVQSNPAPIPSGLERWMVWLPGLFRSQDRP